MSNVDRGRGRLTRLSSEERGELASLLVTNKYVKSAYRQFYRDNPGAHEYPYNSVLAYYRSPQFEETDGPLALAGVREDLEKKPLVPKADRIHQLGDLFWNLKEDFHAHASDLDSKLKIVAELRQILKDLREETKPFDSMVGVITSPFEAFFEQMARSVEVVDVSPKRGEEPGRLQDVPSEPDPG